MPEILHVALPVPLPRLFDYLPPPDDVARAVPGCRVRVPFGRSEQIGLVLARDTDSALPIEQLKPALACLDEAPLLSTELLSSLRWAAEYWLGAPGEAALGALPVWLRDGRPSPATDAETWALSAAGRSALINTRRRGSSRALLETLAAGPQAAVGLGLSLPGWRAAARRLAAAGLIERVAAPATAAATPAAGPPLSDEQTAAVAAVRAEMDRFGAFLLDGVTG
ncbi:MAG TPA: primosomal protein N', partial [Rhodanobacteraceae bacterium]|nr:primosomal protein N' [Rhodanobacteraceae bacterium]